MITVTNREIVERILHDILSGGGVMSQEERLKKFNAFFELARRRSRVFPFSEKELKTKVRGAIWHFKETAWDFTSSSKEKIANREQEIRFFIILASRFGFSGWVRLLERKAEGINKARQHLHELKRMGVEKGSRVSYKTKYGDAKEVEVVDINPDVPYIRLKNLTEGHSSYSVTPWQVTTL